MGSPDGRGRPGCLWTAAASVALIVLAPFAALVHWWRRLRRGSEALVRWTVEESRPLAVIDLSVDVPAAGADRARRGLVDALVRLAERLRQPDDLYHLLWRAPGERETNLVAVGPTPQGLAERLDTALSHRSYERRTQLWLTLGGEVRLGEEVDPLRFDPEREGAPAGLVQRIGPRWAAELSFGRAMPSVLYRARLHVPAEAIERIEAVFSRYAQRLGAEGAR